MHLAPRELDKLVLHGAGFLAQKRLARGLRLSYPEAVALLATQILELIRDGRSVANLMDVGRTLLGRRQVMPGVDDMVTEVQVEGTFRDGTKLVTVHHPIVLEDGDLIQALHGSFLPVPDYSLFDDHPPLPFIVGGIAAEPGEIIINEGREVVEVSVSSTGDRPIQVGSHYPFALVNAALSFDRARAELTRLDIPAGTSVRFEPGETRVVRLVRLPAPAAASASSPSSSTPGATR